MKKVLLLRGVNVGGANRLPMPEFRMLLEELGAKGVETHLQSGNAVFEAEGAGDLETKLAPAMRLRFGFAPALFFIDAKAHAKIVAACPYQAEGAADATAVHVWYLAAGVKPDASLSTGLGGDERSLVTPQALYLHAPAGVGRSAYVAKVDRVLGTNGTARNWRSVQAIAALLG